jgi:hypothetical protein
VYKISPFPLALAPSHNTSASFRLLHFTSFW